jgi:hypothetical protein
MGIMQVGQNLASKMLGLGVGLGTAVLECLGMSFYGDRPANAAMRSRRVFVVV